MSSKKNGNVMVPQNNKLYPGFSGFLVNKSDKTGPRFEMWGRILKDCKCVSRKISKIIVEKGNVLKLTGFETDLKNGTFNYIASGGTIVPFDSIEVVMAISEEDAVKYFAEN